MSCRSAFGSRTESVGLPSNVPSIKPRAAPYRRIIRSRWFAYPNEPIAETLMIALLVVMLNVFAYDAA